jgi:cystathionine gamma-synthase
MGWLQKQMPGGFGSIFAIQTKNENYARRLPSKPRIFQHCTSLGGVESLIEWRKMTDNHAMGDILRVSISIESLEDLKKDLLNGFQALIDESSTNGTTSQ